MPRLSLDMALIQRERLDRLAHERGGERELQFRFGEPDGCLPVRHEGQMLIIPWGCRRGESRVLPVGGWTKLATMESGWWTGAEPVEIPAALGYDGGVWYAIGQGMRGVLVKDERETTRVYVICEPSSQYYRIMTRSAWMPVLIGERI